MLETPEVACDVTRGTQHSKHGFIVDDRVSRIVQMKVFLLTVVMILNVMMMYTLFGLWVFRPYQYEPMAQEKQPREAAEQNINTAMLDHFEIIKLLQSIIHRWKGLLLRYIMVSVVWLYIN